MQVSGDGVRVDKVGEAALDAGVLQRVQELVPRRVVKVPVGATVWSQPNAASLQQQAVRGDDAREVHVESEVEVGVGNVEAAFDGLDVPQVAVPRPPQTPDPFDRFPQLGVVSFAFGGRDAGEEDDAVLDEGVEGLEQGLVVRAEAVVRYLDEGLFERGGAVPRPRGGEFPLERVLRVLEQGDEVLGRDDAQFRGGRVGSGCLEGFGPFGDEALAVVGQVVDAVADEFAREGNVGGLEQALVRARVDVVRVDGSVPEPQVGDGDRLGRVGVTGRDERKRGRGGGGIDGRSSLDRLELVALGKRSQDERLGFLRLCLGLLGRRARRGGGGGEGGGGRRREAGSRRELPA